MEGLMQGFPIPIYFKEDIGLDIEIPKDLLPEGEVMTKLKSKELKDAGFSQEKINKLFGQGNTDNPLEASPMGYPSWWVINTQVGYQYKESLKLSSKMFLKLFKTGRVC